MLTRRSLLAGAVAPALLPLLGNRAAALILNADENGADPTETTISTAALQATINQVADRGGGTVRVPGRYLIDAPLEFPDGVDLAGDGMYASRIRMVAPGDCIRFIGAAPTFRSAGNVSNIRLTGSGGTVGVNALWASGLSLHRVFLEGFARQGLKLDRSIMTTVEHCLFMGNGGLGDAQLEIDHGTTFNWSHNYISGSQPGTIAGLRINRTAQIIIVGGGIESTGIPILLCDKPESVSAVGGLVITGTDLEQPSNGADTYIKAGFGWTGPVGQGVVGTTIIGVNGSPGTTSVPFGIRLKNTDNFRVSGNLAESVWADETSLRFNGVSAVAISSLQVQAVPSNAVVTVAFEQTRFDTAGLKSGATKLVARTAGIHDILGSAQFEPSPSGSMRLLRIIHNGSKIIGRVILPPAGSQPTEVQVQARWQMAAGDYVELQVFHDAAGPLNIQPMGDSSPAFSMVRV